MSDGDSSGDSDSGDWGGGSDGDTSTSTDSRSWFRRLGSALIGLLIGVILLGASCYGIWWNEGRSVRTARSLAEGGASVQQADASRVDPALDNRLVHITGTLSTSDSLTDPAFPVTASGAVQLRRIVEMYQWREESRSQTDTRLGGGQTTTTTYTYNRGWADHAINSQAFNQPDTHRNPPMRHQANTEMVASASLGAFSVGHDTLSLLGGAEPLRLDAATMAAIPGGRVVDGGLYLGQDPANPRVGDLRIRFEVVRGGEVSVIGRQAGTSILPYQARAGGRILLLRRGAVPASEMFQAAGQENGTITWLLRAVLVVVLYIGFALILNPLKVLADVIPALGTLVGFGTGLIALLLTVLVAPLAIAISWFAVRPVLAGGAILGGLALGFGVSWLMRKRRAGVVKPA